MKTYKLLTEDIANKGRGKDSARKTFNHKYVDLE